MLSTASCVRAAIQHNLLYEGPKRLWYMGPMFRHERPQKGRYRQFHQVGVEAMGFAGPDIDAEQIAMCARLWDDLGLQGIRLAQPSIGESFVVTGAGLIGLLTIQMLRANGCRVLAIDFDTQKDVMRSFGATSRSTLIAFKGKTEVGRLVGDTKIAKIKALMAKGL